MSALRTSLRAALAVATLSASQVYAQEKQFSYSYVEAVYIHNYFKSNNSSLTDGGLIAHLSSSTGNGGGVRASLELWNNDRFGLYGVAEYWQTSHTSGIVFSGTQSAAGMIDLTQKELRVGTGGYVQLNGTFDIFAEAAYIQVNTQLNEFDVLDNADTLIQGDLGGLDFDKGSIDLRAGFRARISTAFEVNGYVRRHPYGKTDSYLASTLTLREEFKANLGVRWKFRPNFSMGADYEFGKPGHLRMGARFEF